MSLELEQNPNWKNAAIPKIGDIVHLRVSNGYIFRVEIASKDKELFTGKVLNIFSSDPKLMGEIQRNAEIIDEYQSETIPFNMPNIFPVG
jgi:hypothetical protein